jgi:transketolase
MMDELHFVPRSEFTRLLTLDCPPVPKTEVFAALCRINTLYMIAFAGSGHIGTSFSSMDIVSWLYLNELNTHPPDEDGAGDVFFSSKGHDAPALYSVMIGLGLLPFEKLHELRRLNGLPGHPDVSTPLIETNTGSLGMGISKAKGMALANRMLGRNCRLYVMTGDGELQEGQLWESLGSAANRGLAEITVIVDHNKIQSDTWVKNVSDLGDLDSKFASFGWHVDRCDGHDLGALSEKLAGAKASKKPAIIIADTIKGRGVSSMESTSMKTDEEFYRFHSGAPDEETYARAAEELIERANQLLSGVDAGPLVVEPVARPRRTPPAEDAQRLVGAYEKALVEAGRQNNSLVALDADLILDCGLISFRDSFPDRFFECGIAEQDMVSQAGGMALKGLLPVVHSFACFLTPRANEQIYNNATEKTKIIYVGSLVGLVPGGPGHSHQSVRDISALAAVPDLTLLEPCCEREVGMAVDYATEEASSSIYLRLVSIPCAIPFDLPADYRLEEGRGVTLIEGADAVLFSYGPVMLAEAYKAAESLREGRGVALKVVNLPWLNCVDDDWLRAVLGECRSVFTVDNHYTAGGQGEMLAAAIAGLGLSGGVRVTRFGLDEIPACGTNEEVLRYHGLDSESLASRIAQTLGQGFGEIPNQEVTG